MKANEVHKMSEEELRQEVDRLRRRLFELKSQAVTEKLENPRELGEIRRDVARIKTEQRSRVMTQEQPAE